MQKSILALALLLIIISNMVFAAKPIFRKITLTHGRSISLGQDFNKNSDLFIAEGSGYKLKPGTFGGAAKIVVYLSPERKIESIFFFYSKKKDYQEIVKSYEQSLGPSKVTKTIETYSVRVTVCVWEDDRTRFELVKSSDHSGNHIYSALFDTSLTK